MALDCVHRAYPNQIAHVLRADDDARPPRALTPVFYGCYDWHSAVHGHWLLARASRVSPTAPYASAARDALALGLTPSAVAVEVEYLRERPTFERPYGLAWLLTLQAELASHEGEPWAETLAPLTELASAHLAAWLPKLSFPTRVGTHAQTAFALGLVLDAARTLGDRELASLVSQRAHDFFGDDRAYPLHLEPGGEDFLSPSLGSADLMARLLAPDAFAPWLSRVLDDDAPASLTPVSVTDPADGRLAHLDGLNLSRAWMLAGIADALPERDARRATYLESSQRHADAALRAIDGAHYAGSHWLGTFACYLLTRPARA
ncbi:MAG: DUF2891 domain-containing protein [Myxococcota bacterium]|nr:DUF2891 domain-containing protein [Myxococcota bacterium]